MYFPMYGFPWPSRDVQRNQPLHGWSGADGWLVGCLTASAIGSKEALGR